MPANLENRNRKIVLYLEIEINIFLFRKTRDLLKKIGDIKRMFYARMGMIKDRNVRT